jgi:hypothetical protein
MFGMQVAEQGVLVEVSRKEGTFGLRLPCSGALMLCFAISQGCVLLE